MRKYILLLILLFVYFLLGSCTVEQDQFDADKQDDFESLFSTGMSQNEVEQILDNISDYELYQTQEFQNGDVLIEYRTTSKEWGSPIYYFRFSTDGKLIGLNPIRKI